MSKKSYNPFKMWGSYVGIIIGFSSPWVLEIFNIQIFNIEDAMSNAIYSVLIGIPMGVILGFLLGWGIHLLIRSLNK